LASVAKAHWCWSMPPRGASQPQKPRLTGPPRGSCAAAPSGALRAIDSTARPRSWRTYGPRRLRRQSDADHIVTQRGDRSIDGVSTQARSGGLRWASVTQNSKVPVAGALRPARKVRMPGNWSSVEMGASSAARPGRPEPGLAGCGPARWHREVRRWDDTAWPGAQRTRGARRRRLTSRQTAAHSRWGSGRRRAKTMVATPRSSWPWRSGWAPGSVKARQA
jgi:hypothetical protein